MKPHVESVYQESLTAQCEAAILVADASSALHPGGSMASSGDYPRVAVPCKTEARMESLAGFGVLSGGIQCVVSFLSLFWDSSHALSPQRPLWPRGATLPTIRSAVHIFQFNSHSHYYHSAGYNGLSSLDGVDGEGCANLYENSQPRGFDFSYQCGERLMVSPGYEAYPARWKKQGQTLEILLPQFGKPGAFTSCEMKVGMKDTAYFRHNGLIDEEPTRTFKAWMDKHQYDPEHGKNQPLAPPPAASETTQPQAPTSPPAAGTAAGTAPQFR
jgi:hypothetical protein